MKSVWYHTKISAPFCAMNFETACIGRDTRQVRPQLNACGMVDFLSKLGITTSTLQNQTYIMVVRPNSIPPLSTPLSLHRSLVRYGFCVQMSTWRSVAFIISILTRAIRNCSGKSIDEMVCNEIKILYRMNIYVYENLIRNGVSNHSAQGNAPEDRKHSIDVEHVRVLMNQAASSQCPMYPII